MGLGADGLTADTLLRRHHDDVASRRRYLVDSGLMARANDYYWRLPPRKADALA
ncbi:MAG: DUF2087 domain-containing protein [Chloroflexi bacterium]|nr:DUF2087 domain-containing protein [Chloroflexota bacterium]